MTRKQALLQAIEIIADNEIRAKLAEIAGEIPLTQWTENTIRDAIEQFDADNGSVPTVTDFKRKGLPPHTVFPLRFGMPLSEFLSREYPREPRGNVSPYGVKSRDEWKRLFAAEYDRIRPTSAIDYNKRRPQDYPTWLTLAKMFGISRWSEWIDFCGVHIVAECVPLTVVAYNADLNS